MAEDGDGMIRSLYFQPVIALDIYQNLRNLRGWNISDVSRTLLSDFYAAFYEISKAIPICLLSSSWKIW